MLDIITVKATSRGYSSVIFGCAWGIFEDEAHSFWLTVRACVYLVTHNKTSSLLQMLLLARLNKSLLYSKAMLQNTHVQPSVQVQMRSKRRVRASRSPPIKLYMQIRSSLIMASCDIWKRIKHLALLPYIVILRLCERKE